MAIKAPAGTLVEFRYSEALSLGSVSEKKSMSERMGIIGEVDILPIDLANTSPAAKTSP